MKIRALICGVVIAAMMPAAALADDPHDPAMRSAAARARDAARTRELNRQENARVVRRGVRWHMVRVDSGAETGRNRAGYEREMAEWRRAVAACRAGDYAACDH